MRFCPVASYTSTDGRLLWALGFRSEAYFVSGIEVAHFVYPHFWSSLAYALSTVGTGTSGPARLRDRPNKFVHLAGCLKTYGATTWEWTSWLDGAAGQARSQLLTVAPVAQATGSLKIGGTCPAFKTNDNLNPLVTIIPFTGVIDELRIKTPGQYTANMNGGTPTAITAAQRVIPWPNY